MTHGELITLLRNRGWRQSGGNPPAYVTYERDRITPFEPATVEILVPLNPNNGDYQHLLDRATKQSGLLARPDLTEVLLPALREIGESISVPTPNCECDPNGPCQDCIRYNHLREIQATALNAINTAEEHGY